jgi:drug/metabolite transporter (DMT)-like permease
MFPILLMGGAAASWGVATVTTKVALAQLAPTDLFLLEVGTAGLVIWACLIMSGRMRWPRGWRAFAALGLLNPALSFVLFDLGLARTGAADGALLLASDAVISALLAWAALGERMTRIGWSALAAGTAGVALVTAQAGGHGASLLGDVLVLAASAAAAGYGVGARRFAGGTSALAATGVQLIAALAVAVPIFAIVAAAGHSHLGHVDSGHVIAALATGVLGGGLPFVLFNLAIRDVTVISSALITNLVPLIATALAIGLLGERLATIQLLGGALVVAAAFACASASPEVA